MSPSYVTLSHSLGSQFLICSGNIFYEQISYVLWYCIAITTYTEQSCSEAMFYYLIIT